MIRDFASVGTPAKPIRASAARRAVDEAIKRALSFLVALNFAFLVFIAVSGDLSETNWITGLAARVPALPCVLPTLGLALLCLLLRQVWLAAFHIAGALMAAIVFVPYGFPKAGIQFLGGGEKPKTVRVMSYNVGHGRGDVAGVISAIQSEAPDVFCLQEADNVRLDHPLQVALREKLSDYKLHIDGGMVMGSRLEEVEFKTHSLPRASEGSSIQDLTVYWDGVKTRVVNIHLNSLHPEDLIGQPQDRIQATVERIADEQAEQTDFLLKLVPGSPPLICGDFGQPTRGENYRRLRKVSHDSFMEAGEGLGLTYPSNFPIERSDVVFMAYGWKAARSWIPHTTAAEHMPICADVYPFVTWE